MCQLLKLEPEQSVPTILRIGPYRFFFYSADGAEPPHVHVARDDAVAKYWLDPPRLTQGSGFAAHELRKIRGMIEHRESEMLAAWNEFFGE